MARPAIRRAVLPLSARNERGGGRGEGPPRAQCDASRQRARSSPPPGVFGGGASLSERRGRCPRADLCSSALEVQPPPGFLGGGASLSERRGVPARQTPAHKPRDDFVVTDRTYPPGLGPDPYDP